jgi:hypothetical protein
MQNLLQEEVKEAVAALTISLRSIVDSDEVDEAPALIAKSVAQFKQHIRTIVPAGLQKRAVKPKDETGRHGRAPKDRDDQNFRAGGNGPATEKLWLAYDNNRRQMPGRPQTAFAEAWAALDDNGKQMIRNEEAAAAAAREAAAAAEQKERERQMSSATIKAARAVFTKTETKVEETKMLTRVELYADLRKRAIAQRRDGETNEDALARWIGTVEGRRAFEKYKNAPGDDAAIAAPITPAPVAKLDGAYGEMRRIAEEMCKADPALTRHSAIAKIAADPRHRELWERAKRDA